MPRVPFVHEGSGEGWSVRVESWSCFCVECEGLFEVVAWFDAEFGESLPRVPFVHEGSGEGWSVGVEEFATGDEERDGAEHVEARGSPEFLVQGDGAFLKSIGVNRGLIIMAAVHKITKNLGSGNTGFSEFELIHRFRIDGDGCGELGEGEDREFLEYIADILRDFHPRNSRLHAAADAEPVFRRNLGERRIGHGGLGWKFRNAGLDPIWI